MKILFILALLASCGKTTTKTKGCKNVGYEWQCSNSTSTTFGNNTTTSKEETEKNLTPEERCHEYMKNADNDYQDCMSGWVNKHEAMREWNYATQR